MSVDLSELQRVIFKMEQDIVHLMDEVFELRRIADAVALQSPELLDRARAKLPLSPEIVMQRPDEIAGYLRAHPDLLPMLHHIATALVYEFQGERSDIELVVYQDPEIFGRSLTVYVRVLEYGDAFSSRLESVVRRFDDQFRGALDHILITTDYGPIPDR
jgi:hypothetical protein